MRVSACACATGRDECSGCAKLGAGRDNTKSAPAMLSRWKNWIIKHKKGLRSASTVASDEGSYEERLQRDGGCQNISFPQGRAYLLLRAHLRVEAVPGSQILNQPPSPCGHAHKADQIVS